MTNDLRVLIIEPGGEMRRETLPNSLSGLQEQVGGYIEAAPLYRDDATLFVNEEGKLIGLEPNPVATTLWWTWMPMMAGVDVLCGTVVVTGGVDEEGDTLSIPDDLADQIEAGTLTP